MYASLISAPDLALPPLAKIDKRGDIYSALPLALMFLLILKTLLYVKYLPGSRSLREDFASVPSFFRLPQFLTSDK